MNIRNVTDDEMSSVKIFSEKNCKSKYTCTFLLNNTVPEKIYINEENGKINSVFIVCDGIIYDNIKGFYIYPIFSTESPMTDSETLDIVEYLSNIEKKEGNEFCIISSDIISSTELFENNGFNCVKHRNFTYEIKKNIWQSAEFDIVSASRFPVIRNKFSEESIVHYTKRAYEKYTLFMYSSGGSTAENEQAYCVYYIEKDRIVCKEMISDSTVYATKLLQAIRERTGCEKAVISVSEDSNLFFGEGSLKNAYLVRGLDNPYINLMFE